MPLHDSRWQTRRERAKVVISWWFSLDDKKTERARIFEFESQLVDIQVAAEQDAIRRMAPQQAAIDRENALHRLRDVYDALENLLTHQPEGARPPDLEDAINRAKKALWNPL